VFNFASETALSAAALIDGGAGSANEVLMSSATTLTDADFAYFRSIEALGLTGASSVTLGPNALNDGLGTVIVGNGNTSIADNNSGTLKVNATALGAGHVLTPTGSTAESVTGLTGNLNASGESGALTITATGTSAQSITTGSGNMSIADSTGGGSVVVDATALGGSSSLTLTGSRPETVNNFLRGTINASGLTAGSQLNVTAEGLGSITTGGAATTITDNATGGLTVNEGAGALTLTGAAGTTTVNTGAGSTSIVDNATGALSVNAAALTASHTLTLSGSGSANVTGLRGNLAAGADTGALNVTATGTSAQTIRTGSGADTITAGKGGDTIQGGGGGDTINVSGHTTADTFAYAATSDSLNTTTGHDTITGFIRADVLNFSQISKTLKVQGPVASGSSIAAKTIAWVNLGSSDIVYVNNTSGTLASNSPLLMEIALNQVTGSLSASNFRA
jgi:hypothetical protein